MKRITKAAGIALIAGGLLLTGCAAPSELANYSGEAVIKDHHRSGKSCYATVENPAGVRASVRVGRKSVCTQMNMNTSNLRDGSTIQLKNGSYVK